MFGYIFGLVYLAVGAGGYAATKGVDLTARMGGRELHWFSVNPLHNIAHLAVGALRILARLVGGAVHVDCRDERASSQWILSRSTWPWSARGRPV